MHQNILSASVPLISNTLSPNQMKQAGPFQFLKKHPLHGFAKKGQQYTNTLRKRCKTFIT